MDWNLWNLINGLRIMDWEYWIWINGLGLLGLD
jgi:hypothetical protein